MDIGKITLPQFEGWKTELEDKVNLTNLVPFTYTRTEPLDYQTGIIPPKQLTFVVFEEVAFNGEGCVILVETEEVQLFASVIVHV